MSLPDAPSAGIARRLGALFYDSLLVFSLLFFATAILLPFTDGAAIEPGNAAYLSYLTAVSFTYFGLSWTRGGQTLGMRAWRIKALDVNGAALSWRQSAVRFAAALFGLGLLGMLLGKQRVAWQDRLSRSTTFLVAPE